LKKKVIRVLIIKKGANGISVFILIFLLERSIINTLTNVPIQNAKITAKIPDDKPSIQPIPIINFPSPKPISLPLEKTQRRTNGKAITGPAIKAEILGNTKIGPMGKKLINIEMKERNMKR
jgi:hypothetical protein